MSQLSFRRALVGVLGAALISAVLVAVSAPAPAPASAVEPAPVQVKGLTVNGRVNPLGIPGGAPSFGWHGESDVRGVVQKGYEIHVASTEARLSSPDIWDSKHQVSDRQVDVVYGGPALKPQTRYVWQVRTWDALDRMSAWSAPAWFETGLLSAGDWGGARWIGATPHAELDRWHDYTADFTFSLDDGGVGVVFGARDVGNGYLWQISVADGTPRLRTHVKSNGLYTLMGNRDISSVVSVAGLMGGLHTLSITVDRHLVTTRLDGKVIENQREYVSSYDFIKGFVGVRTGPGEDATIHRVKVTSNTGGGTLLSTDFSDNNPFGVGEINSAGLELERPLEGVWQPDDHAMPLLRTAFASTKTLTRARVYATARGVYQMSLNGQPVGDQHLAPGWTDYFQRIQHQTYDVTDLVRQGDNAWGVELGRGWYAGKIGPRPPGNYGTDLSFLARLRMDYSDGTTQWVDTNDSTWRTRPGPYTATDNMDGESYDARLEQPGFDRTGFDDSGWYPVVAGSDDARKVAAQPDEPVRTTEEQHARRRTNPAPGKYVYDLGQNIVGVARMVLHGKAGTTATIRHGEALNPDGTLYTANLRAAKATDTYTFDADGDATYEPSFTSHGFRYVEISGVQVPSGVTEVTGMVWGSDLPATGSLETSSPMLNQLLSNISWGQRDNFLSIPTDTPARDERLGWTGDISVFAPTASYLRDTRAFLGKWVTDLVDAQEPGGDFTAYAPVPPGYKLGAGAGWADAGITVPYALWQAYGDATVVRQNWDAIARFFAFVRTWPSASLIEDRRPQWGDWLHLDDQVSNAIIGTAYFAQDARMMSEMAAAIGKTTEAAEFGRLYQDIRRAFADAFIAADGTVQGNSQTGYAMAIGMGLVPDELKAKVGAKYVAKIAASGNHLTTGFLGTPLLLPALSAIGRDDIAWQLLMRTEYPSWGYEVMKGATTMWERWNTVMPDGSFGDVKMNSFNHYAYGAVGDWMYRNIGAIAPARPGYKKIRVEPRPGGGVDHGEGTFESVYGTIHTDWTSQSESYRVEGQNWVSGTRLSLAVDVPVNTTADIVVPGQSTAWVREGGAVLSEVPGVLATSVGAGKVTVTVGSGSYRFTSSGANVSGGAPLEQGLQLRRDVAGLVGAGTLSAGDGAALDGLFAPLVQHLRSAYDQDAAGTQPQAEVGEATRAVREVRRRLEASSLSSSGTPSATPSGTASAIAALDDRLAALEEVLSDLTSFYWPVSVSLQAPTHLMPGAVVDAGVVVNNGTYSPVDLVSGSVRVGKGDIVPFSLATARANGTTWVPVTLRIPDDADPGTLDAEVTTSYTAGRRVYELTDVTPITVDSGLQIGSITVQPGTGDPIGRATLKVPVTNASTVAQAVRGEVSGLSATFKTVASSRISVPPGGSATVSIPLVVAYDRDGTARLQGTVALKRSTTIPTATTTTLASKDFSLPLPVQAPPPGAALDYVDFGNATSEAAHQIAGSSSSGTDTLAGLTRRYSHISYPARGSRRT